MGEILYENCCVKHRTGFISISRKVSYGNTYTIIHRYNYINLLNTPLSVSIEVNVNIYDI